MRRMILLLVSCFAAMSVTANGQWLNYRMPNIPRMADGKPNMKAPAPRVPDGKPDLSGIWAAPNGKYLANLAADGIEVSMLPWAQKLFDERVANDAKDRPSGRCMPHSVTDFDGHFTPRKIVQTPGLLIMLFESYHAYRQIFTDGRRLPEDRDPAWYGYSVGKWDGDTLVIDTVGLNEKTWLDDIGHPHTEDLHITERVKRVDFGHIQVQVTIDDPKTYKKPWTATIPWEFIPDTDLLDWVCENERDTTHMSGK